LRSAQVLVFDSLGHYGSAQTDPRGEFALENLYPYSRYRLIARKEGYSPVVDTLSALIPDGRELVVYRMQPNVLSLSGRVVNQGGEALSHTDLSLVSLSDGQSFRTQSDERGNFTFSGLAPHTSFQLRTHRIEEFYVNADTTIRLEQAHRDIGSIIVVERRAALTGRVNQSDVTLTVRNLRTRRITNGYTTEEGNFRLQQLRGGDPGDFILTAQKSGFIVRPDSIVVRGVGIREERQIRTEGELAFVLDEIRLHVSGRVRDSAGAVKAEVPVVLWSPVVQFYDTTDGEGAFRLEGVYPNLTYILSTQLPSQGFDNGRTELALASRDTQDVTLVIGRHNATIAGIVTDESDRPLGQVNVHLDGTQRTSTNPQGEFRIEFVGGGEHRLTFSRSGYRRLEATIHTEIGDREEPYTGRWRLSALRNAVS
ncbi:MAG: carboxypeptidase regulatory-like domain-containing protein, partial [bacterium]